MSIRGLSARLAKRADQRCAPEGCDGAATAVLFPGQSLTGDERLCPKCGVAHVVRVVEVVVDRNAAGELVEIERRT